MFTKIVTQIPSDAEVAKSILTVQDMEESVKMSAAPVEPEHENGPGCEAKRPDDESLINNTKIRAGLEMAIVGINTLTAIRIAEMQYKLAKDYAKLAEDYRNYYKENYEPLEKCLIAEVTINKPYDRHTDKFRKSQMLVSSKLGFSKQLDKNITCTGRYCTGQRMAILNDMLSAQATKESLVAGFAYRASEADFDAREAVRWSRREAVLRIGRDIPSQSVTYAELATGIFGSLGAQAATAANGMANYLGQRYNRNETIYNSPRGKLTVGSYNITNQKLPDVPPVKPREVHIPTPEPKVHTKDSDPTILIVEKG